MIMRWYEENPIDGQEVARSISVGLPPDPPEESARQITDKEEPEIGHIIPEADREVERERLSVKRNSSIPGYTE